MRSQGSRSVHCSFAIALWPLYSWRGKKAQHLSVVLLKTESVKTSVCSLFFLRLFVSLRLNVPFNKFSRKCSISLLTTQSEKWVLDLIAETGGEISWTARHDACHKHLQACQLNARSCPGIRAPTASILSLKPKVCFSPRTKIVPLALWFRLIRFCSYADLFFNTRRPSCTQVKAA